MVPFVLGEEEVVLGFSLIGVKGHTPQGAEEAAQEFSKALDGPQPKLLLITEKVAQWLRPEIRNAILGGALVQVIPGPTGPIGRREGEEALLLSALGIKV
jgi:V/A-type H+-transporting ATPase subunit F